MKIIDKIREHQNIKKPFFSFEYFPPKTEGGLQNLYARLDRMASLEPCFIDITWRSYALLKASSQIKLCQIVSLCG